MSQYKDIRSNYNKFELLEENCHQSPFIQFKTWFDEAISFDMPDTNAMVLSTASQSGKVSSRVVLLKDLDDKGLVFFTNYKSKKGQDLDENPNASLLFFWHHLERQIRIEGKVEKISEEESQIYFNSRPIESQLGAWASKQSEILEDRNILVDRFIKYQSKYENNVPLPEFWGGYRLIPEYFEFWQGRPSRLHDRITYEIIDNSWKLSRLFP
jgi:pyridoxamine 5'-phosphate oxidase